MLDTARQLQGSGFAVTYLAPDARGLITPEAVAEALRPDTFLVSLMLVNNELGTVNDVRRIGEIVRGQGALLHVDAAQAAGKLDIDLAHWAVDLASFSAHKVYGPKGIGALYVGERARPLLQAQIHGGGHEGGLRSGTLATHPIAAMGAAFALAAEVQQEELDRIRCLRERLLTKLRGVSGLVVNGSLEQSIPHTLSLTFSGDAPDLSELARTLAFSSTSACNSGSSAPSHVLLALGHDAHLAGRTIRLSLGRFTRVSDVDQAVASLHAALHPAPFWGVARG